jgi:ABC-type multidrug transport system ATPase subunit
MPASLALYLSFVCHAAPLPQVGLLQQWHSMAGELSGGQRRKLSVAIAFLGGPGVVVLDEPTSGMDPASRRATWQVIRSRWAGGLRWGGGLNLRAGC